MSSEHTPALPALMVGHAPDCSGPTEEGCGCGCLQAAYVEAAASDLLMACEEGAMYDPDREEPFPDTLERIGRGTEWEDYCVEKAKQIRAAITKARGES